MANFGDWRVLIWRICDHVPLSMHIMAQNGGFLFWQMAIKIPILPIFFSLLQNYQIYSIYYFIFCDQSLIIAVGKCNKFFPFLSCFFRLLYRDLQNQKNNNNLNALTRKN